MSRNATIARALTLGSLTISTTKGSHTGTLAEVCAWQAEHQGAIADVCGVDVSDIDFDGDDIDAAIAAVTKRLAAGALVLDLGTIVAVAHSGIADEAQALYDAADDAGMLQHPPRGLRLALRDLGAILVDEDGAVLA